MAGDSLWHYSPKTHRAERCSAGEGNCPYGGEHVSGNSQDARVFEARMNKEKYELFTPVSKKAKIEDSTPKIKIARPKKYVWSREGKLRGYENISESLMQDKLKLRPSQVSAVDSYTGAGYKNMNNYLRGTTIKPESIPRTVKSILNLQSIFNRIPPLKEDIVVKRTQKDIFGFNFEDFEDIPTMDDVEKPKIRIKGFLSTSANTYSGGNGFNFTDNDSTVEFNIIVPKGMKVLDVNKVIKNPLSYEEELLVEHDTVLVVDKVDRESNTGRKRVFAHIMPKIVSTYDDRNFYNNVDLSASGI